MRFNSSFVASVATFGLFLCASTLPSAVQAAEVTTAQVAAARTAADHEAIASAYEAEATAADKMASDHEAMAKAYNGATGMKGGRQAMVSHCNRLVDQYRAAATEYRGLAAAHRELAKTAGK
jgi:hypothetical protein